MVILPEFMALWLALSLYNTAAFIGEIVRGWHHVGQSWSMGSCWRTRHQTQPYFEPCDYSTSHAGDYPAADESVPQPDQELILGDRDWVHGYRRNHWAVSRSLTQTGREMRVETMIYSVIAVCI